MFVFWLMGIIFLGVGLALLFASRSFPGFGDAIGVALVFVPLGALFIVIGIYSAIRGARKRRIRTSGIPGTARIMEANTTGISINDSPLFELDLEIQIPGRSPYRVRHRTTIPFLAFNLAQIGSQLPVRVDPGNPNDIVVEFTPLPGTEMTSFSFSGPPGSAPLDAAAIQELQQLAMQAQQIGERFHGSHPGGFVMGQPGGAGHASGYPMAAGAPGVGSPSGGSTPSVSVSTWSTSGSTDPATGSAPPPGASSSGGPSVADAGRGGSGLPDSAFEFMDPGDNASLLLSGLPARVTLEQFEPTGVAVRGDDVYRVQLSVRPDHSSSSYTARLAVPIAQVAAGRLVPGATFPARLDPLNASKVAVDWTG